MRSMTGFGQGSAESSRWRFRATVRSVNHRHLDVALRLRDELRPLEPRLRSWIRREVHRGRVDLTVDAVALEGSNTEVRVDGELAQRLIEELRGLAKRCDLSTGTGGEMSLGDLLRLPEVITIENAEPEWSEDEIRALEAAVSEAVGALVALRDAEGAALREALGAVREGLREVGKALEARREVVVPEMRKGLSLRLQEVLGDGPERAVELDPGRLEQEVALLVEKSDVTEELDRLESHCQQLDQALAQEGPVGRRLDFLSQEVLRELNTVGSKCRDAEMTSAVIEGKLLCEQLREQSQNVE